jgi:hypothetical protein
MPRIDCGFQFSLAISQNSLKSRIPARVVVGVTGHRNLVTRPELVQAIRSAIERIGQMLPSLPNTPLTLTVLSPLAEGADRLISLEVLNNIPSSTLEVVLPMEKDDYLKDFGTGQSRAEFEGLLSRATTVKILPSGKNRPESYEQVGQYIVDQCDILVALWDGKQAEGQGGTADVVHYARENSRPLVWINTENPEKVTIELGHGLNVKAYQDLDGYNSEQVDAANFEKQLRYQRDSLVEQAKSAKLRFDAIQPTIEYFMRHFVRADLLASHYQKMYYRMGTTVYVLAAAAVVLVVAQRIFFAEQPRILIAEIIFMLAVLLINWLGRRRRWHTKWLDYRFLAERLRSAMWIALSKMDVAALRPPRHLSLAYSPNDWMVAAFFSVWSRRPKIRDWEQLSNEGFRQFLSEAWIEDQIRYQDSASIGHYKRHQLMSYVSNALFGLTLIVAILHVIDFGTHWLERTLFFLAGALPATAASITAIRTHRDYLRKSMRSSEMAIHLRELREKISKAKDRESFLKLVSDVEETMLYENEDWRVAVRFHTPELPV